MTRLRTLLRPYWLFLPLCAGVFVAAGDQTVIVTVLPDVLADLRVGASELDRASWAITGYLIGFTAAMPLMGRVSDRFGYRNTYLGALLVFTLGSAAVAISPQLPGWLLGREPEFSWMVGARVFQAIGGGAIIPVTVAAASELVDSRHRVIAYGLVGASAEAGGVIGPLWGGAITHLLSWHWAFWLNIPFALVVGLLLLRAPAGQRHAVHIDITGAGLFAAALTLLTVALTRVGEPDTLLVITAAGAGAATLLLVLRNLRVAQPIFPRSLFRRMSFNTANTAHFLIGAALIIGMVTIPLMAATVYGLDALEGGLRLLRMTIAIGAGAVLGGVVTQRAGALPAVVAGLGLSITGFLLMSGWELDTGDPAITLHTALTGLGFGLLIAPVAESALRNVSGGERGAGSALLTVSRMIGMTVGLAAMTSIGTAQFSGLVADLPAFSLDPGTQAEIQRAAADAGLQVFRDLFRYAAIALALAVVPALYMTRARAT